MKCPKCGAVKHRIPESRRTDDNVWRIRICGMCLHSWVTQEIATDLRSLPSEVHKYHNEHRKPAEKKPKKKVFDTSSLTTLQWHAKQESD